MRDRLRLDPGSEFEEDWLFARSLETDTPADGVVTGIGRVGGRPVCIMANDDTVKAGSWGEKTVQKIVRVQEKAARLRLPMLYLVDAAGGWISEQTVAITVTRGLTLRLSSDMTVSLGGVTVGGAEIAQDDLAGGVSRVAVASVPAGVDVDA